MKSEKRYRFILSRKNQKGQVAVFVALIFQVVFVFFAMLINVGLLVHHKINLQQSTDLAAYYGAMKQAEILNVMAHVNYQIRQSWKLFTWRYRVLGTFGMEKQNGGNINPSAAPIFPIAWEKYKSPVEYNSNPSNLKCVGGNADGMNFTDTPFLCMGHNGFQDWFAGKDNGETFCKIDCSHMNNASTNIKSLSGVGGFSWGSANIGSAVNKAITKTNENMKKRCDTLGPVSLASMGLFYSNYYADTNNRKKIIKVLNNNLSQPENEILDLDGKKVFTGVENTLKNNLTEANKSSLTPTSITTYNGAKDTEKKLISEIAFQYLNFFLLQCQCNGSNANNCGPKIDIKNFGDDSSSGAFSDQASVWINFKQQYGDIADETKQLFGKNSVDINTLGFEKNPWYNVYYGVKATSEPRIPFLPLSKIKLNAISFAKPFGGTLGPWYYKTWSQTSDKSTAGDWEQGRTDYNLPARTAQEAGFSSELVNKLKDSIKVTPNFSLYVDDKLGLRDHKYLGIYQGMLNAKVIPNSSPSQNTKISADTKISDTTIGFKYKPNSWPRMSEWSHLGKTPNDSDYDPLAIDIDPTGTSAKNTFSRDIEVSVVAPNQFDVSYYSIEPNFYQAYGKDILVEHSSGQLKSGFREMANKAGEDVSKLSFPYDFGSTVNDKIAGLTREFNVSRQLQVVAELFAGQNPDITKLGIKNLDLAKDMFFTFIPRNPAATLTGWTYNDPRKYKEFPEPKNEAGEYTMQFGSCNDERTGGSGNEKIYSTLKEDDKSQPDVPGNCVTGGRTGYSVKLISSDMVRVKTKHKDLGGPGTNGPIANPVDENFLKF